MNIQDYLRNPGGKGNAAFNQGNLIDSLDRKYARLIDARKSFSCTIYKVRLKEIYYIHIVVPSEADRDNSYDVVVQFSDTEGQYGNSMSIGDYDVRFFCNSPSFVYTFARSYTVNDLFITELKNKLPSDATTKDSEVRNVYGIVNYDKYLYFACRYLYDSRFLSKETITLRAKPYNKSYLFHQVRNFDTIMKEYKLAERKAKDAKKKLDPSKPPRTKIQRFDKDTLSVGKSGKVPKQKGSKSSAKKVKSVKKK